MEENNLLPSERDELVKTDIEYSVKIGKQVMKKQLNSAIDAIQDQIEVAKDSLVKTRNKFNKTFADECHRKVKLGISNDSNMTRFRNIFNQLSRFNKTSGEYKKFSDNTDMIAHTNASTLAYDLINSTKIEDEEVRLKFLTSEPITITVDLDIPDRFSSNDEDHYAGDDYENALGYGIELSFGEDIKELFHQARDAQRALRELDSKAKELKDKLKNIDQVTEEMEANLLVAELNRTEKGKKTLEIAGGLISEMLGETPELLKLK